jgi:hypothetical protein
MLAGKVVNIFFQLFLPHQKLDIRPRCHQGPPQTCELCLCAKWPAKEGSPAPPLSAHRAGAKSPPWEPQPEKQKLKPNPKMPRFKIKEDDLKIAPALPVSRKPPELKSKTHRYPNGEYIRRSRPAVYAKVVAMLSSAQYSMAQIAKEARIDYVTVCGIYETQKQTIEEQRAIITAKVGRTMRKLIERVEEKADTMRPRDAIFGVSVFANQWALLTGAATAHNLNVNISTDPVNIAAQFDKLHAAIQEKAASVTAAANPIPQEPSELDASASATHSGTLQLAKCSIKVPQKVKKIDRSTEKQPEVSGPLAANDQNDRPASTTN